MRWTKKKAIGPTSAGAVGLHGTSGRDRCTVDYLDCADRGVVQEVAINLVLSLSSRKKVVPFQQQGASDLDWTRLHARSCDSWPTKLLQRDPLSR